MPNKLNMRYYVSKFALLFIFVCIHDIRAIDWIDYDEPISTMDTGFDDDSEQYLSALARDEEHELYSPLITGYKYVSGGAGEGRQHLSPSGDIPNRPEVKTDEELPAFCSPPNPCPLGFEADDCDASPMAAFTAEYSRLYQSEQNCHCDGDHDHCSSTNTNNGMLKRSRRLRREISTRQKNENDTNSKQHRNSFQKSQSLRFHVAKKSPISLKY